VGRRDQGDYIDAESVQAELLWARRLCAQRGWPVIDVTRRSIEETAAAVITHMQAWHDRRRKAADLAAQASSQPSE
jgi:regulator of PEP synthase PpsR (kinase-PPPase family)